MRKRVITALLSLLIAAQTLTGCGGAIKTDNRIQIDTETGIESEESDPVTLKIAGIYEDFPAMEMICDKYTAEHPNVEITYEYVQNYYNSMTKRLSGEDNDIDIFLTVNIQTTTQSAAFADYALDFYSRDDVDLSGTFDGLIQNFVYRGQDGGAKKIYAIPLGAEIRGLFVNTTLLDKFGLSVPADRTELLEDCRVLYENGCIPLQGNPGIFSQQFLYPYICNLIANADDPEGTYNAVNTHQAGVGELFREPMEFLYNIVASGYYNYKTVENKLGLYVKGMDNDNVYNFLNIKLSDNGKYEKIDDVGQTAFMPGTMSMSALLEKVKEDYHSAIDFTFILAPVGEDGGYSYMSPGYGIAVNKMSKNVDWAVDFINYIFTPENNTAFAEEYGITPNVKDALNIVGSEFDVSSDHICQLGQVTFDYDFYKIIVDTLTEISKANNPSYMNKDENGNAVMYGFDYYMEKLEQRFANVK